MIGKLTSLQKLGLGNYDDSMELEPGELKDHMLYSLKECPIIALHLTRCKIYEISGGVVNLARLQQLYIYECNSILSIPNLPGNITSIEAQKCASLVNLPCNIYELKSLKLLAFDDCPKLGTEDPNFLMKVTGLTNMNHLTMSNCSVSQVPCEIGNLVSLKELDLSYNTFSSLPDSLSNLSQLVYLLIKGCVKLRLLPLLPSNLTDIPAYHCPSLDVMSSASIRIKVCKESPFSNRPMVRLTPKKVPDWCSYQSQGDVLSFVAPVHLDNNICGIILCANTSDSFSRAILPEMYNKTKNACHDFERHLQEGSMCVMPYPLDKTTLLVEPGDSVVLKLPQGSVSSCGLRLIYESDVVDCNLVI